MTPSEGSPTPVSGRCYCGETFAASKPPQSVACCHCADCRRATGGPVAAFAAFEGGSVAFSPNEERRVSAAPGVARSFCAACGSPLTGRYDCLPGQVCVLIGIIDQAEDFAPEVHAHEGERLAWLHIDDDIERRAGTAADALKARETPR